MKRKQFLGSKTWSQKHKTIEIGLNLEFWDCLADFFGGFYNLLGKTVWISFPVTVFQLQQMLMMILKYFKQY